MLRRDVDRLGRAVGAVGYGGRSLTPEKRAEPRDAQRVLYQALEAGVDVVDVSPGWGESETLAGEVVRELRARDRVLLCTRVPGAPPPRQLQAAVEQSLRATRLEVLPLVQLEAFRDAWRTASTWPEIAGTMARLIREGKALAWGAIVDDVAAAETVTDEPAFATIQVALHAGDRAAAALVARAAAAKLGVLVARPLGGGDALTAVAPVVTDEVDDPAELALRWVLDQPVTTALVGTRSSDHLRRNLTVADGRRLSPALHERIAELP